MHSFCCDAFKIHSTGTRVQSGHCSYAYTTYQSESRARIVSPNWTMQYTSYDVYCTVPQFPRNSFDFLMFHRNRVHTSEVLCETGILLPEIPQKCHNCCAESRKSVDCQNHDVYCTNFSSHRTSHLTSQIIPVHFISQMNGKMTG